MQYPFLTLLDWAREVEIYGVPIAVSAFYFILLSSQPLTSRVLASVHGLLFIAAIEFASMFGGRADANQWRRPVFYALMALGLASVVYSLWGRKVRPIAHFSQVLNVAHAVTFLYLGELAFDPE
jgi:hypothetical protein